MLRLCGCQPAMRCQRQHDGIHLVGRGRTPGPNARQYGVKLEEDQSEKAVK